MRDTLKKKKRKKKKAIRPRCVTERNTQLRAETESHIRPFFCEFQREKNTEKRELQLRGAVQKDREKHNKSVRE